MDFPRVILDYISNLTETKEIRNIVFQMKYTGFPNAERLFSKYGQGKIIRD